MRIELLLEDGAGCMVQSGTAGTASAYEISNATLNLQSTHTHTRAHLSPTPTVRTTHTPNFSQVIY